MKYNYIDIGNRIRENRKRVGIKSQEDLIDRLKDYGVSISRNSLSNIENGVPKESISLNLLAALCEIFDCDIGYLLCEYDERHHVAADVCAATGLTEKAVEVLRFYNGMKEDSLLISVVSKLIEQEEWISEEIDDGVCDEYGNTVSTLVEGVYSPFPILSTITNYLRIKRNPNNIYHVTPDEVTHHKGLLAINSLMEVPASLLAEQAHFRAIETMLEKMKEEYIEK